MVKIIFIFLFLNAPLIVKADNISDFEIEGITIGDSALNYFNENEIKKQIKDNNYMYDYLEKGKFGEIYMYEGLETYDYLSFMVDLNNSNYLINRIAGHINFIEDIEGCRKKRDEIINDLENLFKNLTKTSEIESHPVDSSGESIQDAKVFWFNSGSNLYGDVIAIECTDFEESIRKKNNWGEGLAIVAMTKEINDWFNNF